MCWASVCCAGAWPRGEGKTFAASSASLTWPDGRALEYPDIYGSLYVEHGLGKRLTLGLDLGTPDATRPNRLKAISFVRLSLSDPSARHQFAVDLGAGRYLGAPALRIGAAYGAGMTLWGNGGWLSLEGYALYAPQTRGTTVSADATLGVSLKRGKLIAQLSAFRDANGQTTTSFTPSYVRQITPERHLEIGVTFGLQGKPDPALKLGVWQDF